ncbi:GGDEF domain-containing protein [Kineococcus rhizosphaerae]|uniref:Diguanylate cyclase (GGDEF)-like protein n=1 Tax=Kineococcus rhizosphaerae TaxID=559628 RepID=A0A2T0R5Y9_9ACTN|nr:GGDEF domain-containing protein [Kineococcus rhizosphaerae]PRY16584.1 diguanylate cyclase (GGDEF)-like protein [Kineococcus rhizosphaerae]
MTPAGADWRTLASRTPATLLLTGTTVLWASADLQRLVGADPQLLVGRDVLDLVVEHDRARARSALAEAVRRPGERLGPLRVRPRQRPDLRVEVVARARGAGHVVLAVWDVSERVAAERSLEHRASHDVLTGLPNRALLAERWERSRARAGPAARTFVLLCDVDGLKEVNDRCGHRAGDALLVEVARRLAAEVRPGDTVARLGGDEFVVLVDAVPPEHVEALVRRLRRTVLRAQEGADVRLSVGWAADDADRSFEAVLAEADGRMYEDKRANRGVTGGSP